MSKKRSNDEGQSKLEPLTELRRQDIERAAYFRAERRGFAPWLELEDWLEAEREINEASEAVA